MKPRPFHNPIIECGCGCGRKLKAFDPKKRPRLFITGHNNALKDTVQKWRNERSPVHAYSPDQQQQFKD